MRVFITGSSGFIGTNLLAAMPKDWEAFSLHHSDFHKPDFSALRDWDLGIHLAGNSNPMFSTEIPRYDLELNIDYLIQICEGFNFGKFIYFSSGAIYDGLEGSVNPHVFVNPKLPYAISKLAAEQYLKYFKKIAKIKELCIVRFFGAYGPHEPERKIYSKLVKRFGIERKPEFTIQGDGTNLIDAMYIDDAVRAILQIAENMPSQEIIDLYADKPLTIKSLVDYAATIFGIEPIISFEGEAAEPIKFWSNDKAFQFKPEVSLKDGLLELRNWLLSKGEESQCLQS